MRQWSAEPTTTSKRGNHQSDIPLDGAAISMAMHSTHIAYEYAPNRPLPENSQISANT